LAVIIKGTSCAGASRLAAHLTRTDTNERAEVKELRGVVAENLSGALREMEAVAAGARTTKPFYHGSINTRADERLTDEQRVQAIDRLEAALGLTGQARVVVVHEKEGREHCHIVWSRIDLARMAAISDSNNYRKHEEVARSLEREFGHERVQGAHVERNGNARPERTPSHSEMLQSVRTGIGPHEAKETLTGIWKTTKNGKEFQAALEKKGWTLARGDRRDFVAIDPNGGVHSIARRIKGAKAADVRRRFADIDPKNLNSVAEAKQVQRERNGGPEWRASRRPRDEKGRSAQSKKASQARGLKAVRDSPKPKEPKPPHIRDMAQPSQSRQELMRQSFREIPQRRKVERDQRRLHATGTERRGAGAAPVPISKTPHTKRGFSSARRFRHTGRSLTRWRGTKRIQATTKKGGDDVRVEWSRIAKGFGSPGGFGGQSLPEMRNPDRQEGRKVDPSPPLNERTGGQNGMPSASTGEGNPDVPTNGGASEPPDVSPEFRSEMAAVRTHYGAKIAAARRRLPASDLAVAIRAILDEETIALRAVTERWRAATERQKWEMPQRPTGTVQRKGDPNSP
jgi:hypothetical protein